MKGEICVYSNTNSENYLKLFSMNDEFFVINVKMYRIKEKISSALDQNKALLRHHSAYNFLEKS